MSQEKSKPVKSFSAGSIQASIWKKETEKDGQTVVRYSVKIQKQFRKKDGGQWQDTSYYFPEDLPKLQLVTAKCFEYISLTESKDSEEQTPV